jgi:nitroreductase/FMN reductase [NAD(P)H]
MGKTIADQIEERFGLPTKAGRDRAAQGTLSGILGRAVCRKYKPDPIPDELMEMLLAAAQSGPTKSNLQQYSILLLSDRERIAKLADLVPTMPWIAGAPNVLVFLGDVRRIRRLAEWRGHDYRNNIADTFMNAAVDAAIALQSFVIAAEAEGLGICPISYIRNRLDELQDLLGLPGGVFPIAGLCVGWPEVRRPVSMRLPPSVVVHRETYDDSRLTEEVAAYDERAHARHPIAPGSQRHRDLYGELEKCVWSENVTRQLSRPERDAFAGWLKKNGILLD